MSTTPTSLPNPAFFPEIIVATLVLQRQYCINVADGRRQDAFDAVYLFARTAHRRYRYLRLPREWLFAVRRTIAPNSDGTYQWILNAPCRGFICSKDAIAGYAKPTIDQDRARQIWSTLDPRARQFFASLTNIFFEASLL